MNDPLDHVDDLLSWVSDVVGDHFSAADLWDPHSDHQGSDSRTVDGHGTDLEDDLDDLDGGAFEDVETTEGPDVLEELVHPGEDRHHVENSAEDGHHTGQVPEGSLEEAPLDAPLAGSAHETGGKISLPLDDADDLDLESAHDPADDDAVGHGHGDHHRGLDHQTDRPVDLDVDVDHPWATPGLGFADLLDHVLSPAGLDVTEAFEVAGRLGLADDLTAALDGHSTAVVLGELGADAVTEHGGIDDVAERLDAGDEVLLTDRNGNLLTVIDVGDDVVIVSPHDSPTTQLQVPTEAFESAWAESAYEMVTIGELGPHAPGIALTGSVTLIQATLAV